MIDTTVTVSTLTFEDMCFRITDLEAKLAEAVAVGVRVRDYFTHQTSNDVYAVSDFNKAIAKLKG
jgi:hypothetical protein